MAPVRVSTSEGYIRQRALAAIARDRNDVISESGAVLSKPGSRISEAELDAARPQVRRIVDVGTKRAQISVNELCFEIQSRGDTDSLAIPFEGSLLHWRDLCKTDNKPSGGDGSGMF